MTFYIFQSLVLGAALLVIARRNATVDTFSGLFIAVWTISVIAIKFIYQSEQSMFYSNDQQLQLEMYERLITNGLSFSPQQFIADRYLIIIPVRFFAIFGFEPILATKFLQAVCLLLLYRLCVNFLERNDFRVRLIHAVFFTGPLFIFISTLGLRDLEIALASTYFLLGKNLYLKQLSLLVLIPLRPHLAAALIFGWLAIKLINFLKIKRNYFSLSIAVIGAFALGGFTYVYGRNFQFGNAIVSPAIFNQNAWWRFFSNLAGLQFLSFDQQTRNLSIRNLLMLRLIFVDSFLIPICFVITLLAQKLELSRLRLQLFISFAFFLGLASQTDFNSTRQNLPFLSTMGVLALLGLLRSSTQDSTNSRAEVATIN